MDELLVVTGHDADAVESALTLPASGRFVRNPDYRDGQSTSLAAAFHEVDDESEARGRPDGRSARRRRRTSCGRWSTRFRADAQADRAARRTGTVRGPSLLSREIYAEAGHLHGDVGARVLIASHPEWVEEVAIDGRAPRDVDTPEDLRLGRRDSSGPLRARPEHLSRSSGGPKPNRR